MTRISYRCLKPNQRSSKPYSSPSSATSRLLCLCSCRSLPTLSGHMSPASDGCILTSIDVECQLENTLFCHDLHRSSSWQSCRCYPQPPYLWRRTVAAQPPGVWDVLMVPMVGFMTCAVHWVFGAGGHSTVVGTTLPWLGQQRRSLRRWLLPRIVWRHGRCHSCAAAAGLSHVAGWTRCACRKHLSSRGYVAGMHQGAVGCVSRMRCSA
mmetsp:Transcript_18326/g.51839  ORF Transcript_18326/g.51839 Transcript_18326/m.51839 type:complete len:209 (-) Transcript_18326:1057-1683(-)